VNNNNGTMDKIREKLSNKKIWVSIDESMRSPMQRGIENVIHFPLDENGAGEIFLLNSDELEEANH